MAFAIVIDKRDMYIKAWNYMYKMDKKSWNLPMFDGVNPSLNKTALKTEKDNICAIVFDESIPTEEFSYGMPVGIFSMVITDAKVIGKQFVVHPSYQSKGLGKALVLILEKKLRDKGYDWYYIGCSSMSARIMRSFGSGSYSDDTAHDLFKFIIRIDRASFNEQYNKYIVDRGIKIIERI